MKVVLEMVRISASAGAHMIFQICQILKERSHCAQPMNIACMCDKYSIP